MLGWYHHLETGLPASCFAWRDRGYPRTRVSEVCAERSYENSCGCMRECAAHPARCARLGCCRCFRYRFCRAPKYVLGRTTVSIRPRGKHPDPVLNACSVDGWRSVRTRQPRPIGGVCIGLAIALFVLPGVVGTTNVHDGWAVGSTSVSGSCLTMGASITNKVYRSPLNLGLNDTVTSHYNISWSDTRHAPAASATHRFHLQSAWAVTIHWDAWYNNTTTGGQSGSTSLSVTTAPVDADYNLAVIWEASISMSSCPTVSASDSATIALNVPPY